MVTTKWSHRRSAFVVLCLLGLSFQQAVANDRMSSNMAEVVTATFIGGEGSEWLTSAAFPGDDSILLGGTSLDPELTIHGVKARVLGKDAPPLEKVKDFRSLDVVDTGKTAIPGVEEMTTDTTTKKEGSFSLDEPPTRAEIEKKAREKAAKLVSVPGLFQYKKRITVEKEMAYVRFSWLDPQATGFIGRFDSTLKSVRALCRFPRGSCGFTAMGVDTNGNVYVTGFANDSILGASEDCREEKTSRFQNGEMFNIGRYVFVARVSPDLGQVVWIRQLKYMSYTPRLRVLQDGNIAILGPGYAVFSPDGRLLQTVNIKFQRISSGSAICPVTGRFSLVGDWLGMTGREPMRVPRLLVIRPDGVRYKHLLTWGSSFFCPNYMHLVADSAVRRSAYDDEGNLIYSTWSHGGNNCPGRFPYDPERDLPNAMNYGGMSTYCYVVKLDPENNVKTAMLWTSAGGIDLLSTACDKSIVWMGWTRTPDLTPNAISRADVMPWLVLTEPNLTGYRFYSSAPACGTRVLIGGCDNSKGPEAWAVASGRCDGRPKLLYLTGAVTQETDLAVTYTPPLKNPVQEYGGGLMDGYAILLDLTPKTELGMELPKPKPPPPPIPGEKPPPPRKPEPYKGTLIWPYEGQVWKIGEERCVTVMVTVRDEHSKMWPNFYSGRGVKGGRLTFGTNSASVNLTLDASGLQQDSGIQTQRVLGELLTVREEVDKTNGEIKVIGTGPDVSMKLNITNSSPWERTDELYGVFHMCPYCRCTMSGVLEFGQRKIAVTNISCMTVFLSPPPDRVKVTAPHEAHFDANFTVPGKDLGLSGPLADQNIRIRFRWEAISDVKMEAVADPSKAPAPNLDDAKRDDGNRQLDL